MNKTVALVGAYERDNFGDLLFAFVTHRYLEKFNVIYSAPLSGSADHLLSQPVVNYQELFRSGTDIDAIWTVGGHVGGARPNAPASNYPGTPPQTLHGIESPYLPRLSRYAFREGIPSVINSVSFGGVLRIDPVIRTFSKAAALEADIVSVRDRASQETLEAWGVPHLVAPDIVHSLPLHVPSPAKNGSAVIQFSEKHFDRDDLQDFAKWVATSANLAEMPVVLFAAGLAPNHDSLEVYEHFVDLVKSINPSRKISIEQTRSPLELAEIVGGASLWFGTSLHGRIISASFGVPRMSWERWKLISYCRNWDEEMPFDVTLENLESRLERALSIQPNRQSSQLINKADANARNLVDRLTDEMSGSQEIRLKRRIRASVNMQKELRRVGK